MTNFDEVFDKIMRYKKGDITKVKTKEDLRDFLKEMDTRGTIDTLILKGSKKGHNLLNVLVETTPAENIYSKGEAVAAELARTLNAREADESRTAKTVKTVTAENLKQWKKNPAAFDLRGIDTKTHTSIKEAIAQKVAKARAAGFTVKGASSYNPVRLEKGGRRARSVINGRFVKVAL